MVVAQALGKVLRVAIVAVVVWPLVVGCQVNPGPSNAQLVEESRKVDEAGLDVPAAVAAMNVHAALPLGWMSLGIQRSALYTHQQWRSPSKRTAVGSTYVRMPLPLSTKALVWVVLGEAGKRTTGKILRQWTDELGREWFEAENGKYRMTGYVMTRGFDAWINYAGYRLNEEQNSTELELAGRSLATFVPLSAVKAAEKTQTASAE